MVNDLCNNSVNEDCEGKEFKYINQKNLNRIFSKKNHLKNQKIPSKLNKND